MKKNLMVLASGFFGALTHPTYLGGFLFPDFGFLAWISLVPFYLVLKRVNPLESLRLSFAFGLMYFGVMFYYGFRALHAVGKIDLAISFLLFGFMIAFLSGLLSSFVAMAISLSRRGIPLFLTLPIAWVAYDLLCNYFPMGGLPIGSFAYTQRSFLTLLQVLDLAGVYLVTFLIILSNAMVGELLLWFKKERVFPRAVVVTFLLLFTSALLYGRYRLVEIRRDADERETLRIGIVQGNITPRKKWDRGLINEAIQKHVSLSQALDTASLDLLLWPEAPHPAAIKKGDKTVDQVSSLKTPLLTGFMSYVGKRPEVWPLSEEDRKGFVLYNSAVLIDPGGVIAGVYRKNHLVPFGEYVPMRTILRNVGPLVPTGANFSPGTDLTVLNVQNKITDKKIGIGTMICFEDLFPEIARSYAKKGVDLLVNLTNNGWYGRSSIPFQHLDFSRYRAIENRRSLARATNSGVTAFFSPTGEIIAQAPFFQEAKLSAEVPLGGPLTFYTRYGDLFAWSCVAILATLLLAGALARIQI